jgi:hypothetical protein
MVHELMTSRARALMSIRSREQDGLAPRWQQGRGEEKAKSIS